LSPHAKRPLQNKPFCRGRFFFKIFSLLRVVHGKRQFSQVSGRMVGISDSVFAFLIICRKTILFPQIPVTFFLLWSHTFTIIPKPILWFGEDFGELENFPKHRGRVYFGKEGFTPSQNAHDCGSFAAK